MSISDYFTNVIRQWKPVFQGQPPPVNCSQGLETVMTNRPLEGTVSNVKVGDGIIDQSCDLKRILTTEFTLTTAMPLSPGVRPTFAVSNVIVKLDGYQACTWAMSFEAGDTKLSGTIEQTFTFQSDTASIPCPAQYDALKANGLHSCVEVVTSAKVFVTGGAGKFDGATGTGTFNSTSLGTLFFPFLGSQSTTPQASSLAAEVTSFAAPRAPISAFATDGDGFSLNLERNPALKVRLVAPAEVGGARILGLGPDGRTQLAVKFSSAPGSVCRVSAAVAQKRLRVQEMRRDADGAVTTKITSRLLERKLGVKKGAKVAITIDCRLGERNASTTKVVRVGD